MKIANPWKPICFTLFILLISAGVFYFLGCRLAPNDMCIHVDSSQQRFNEGEARALKPAILALKRPDTVFIGGSRTLDQLSPAYHAYNNSAYNFSVVAVTPYELNALTQYAVDVTEPRHVIISLAHITFLLGEKYRRGFRLEEKASGGMPNPKFYFSILEALFQPLRIDRGYLARLNNTHKLFGSDGSKYIHKKTARCEYNNTDWQIKYLTSYTGYFNNFLNNEHRDDIYQANVRQITDMLSYLQSAGTDVTLILLPVHDSVAATRAMTGITDHYLAWMQDMVTLARQAGVSRFLVFDDLDGLTNEAFTYRSDCDGYDLDGWYNPAHAYPEMGHQLQINEIPGVHFRWTGSNVMQESALNEYVSGVQHRYQYMQKACTSYEGIMSNCFIESGKLRDGVVQGSRS